MTDTSDAEIRALIADHDALGQGERFSDVREVHRRTAATLREVCDEVERLRERVEFMSAKEAPLPPLEWDDATEAP